MPPLLAPLARQVKVSEASMARCYAFAGRRPDTTLAGESNDTLEKGSEQTSIPAEHSTPEYL